MTDFDAIVVGSGMSGGWSAKELCERGLKVLVLERGPEIKPERDYVDQLPPWEQKNLDRISQDEIEKHYFKQYPGVAYAVKESNKHFWVKDDEHPYETVEGTEYDWLRGYHTAGRSIMWSRQSYRMGPQDFTANKDEGVAIDWPVRYDEIKPWYDYVEEFVGVAGNRDGLEQLPDGVYQPGFELTDAEKFFKSSVESTFPGRNVIQARVAHLTEATDEQRDLGRSNCQARNRCHFGCAFKAYFSSLHAGANGLMNGFENQKVFGRRPGGIYIPRYANITEEGKPYTRGFGYQGSASPIGNAGGQIAGIGRTFKEAHRSPGPWRISIGAFGEQLPNPNNRVTLHPNKKDKWGNPIALFNVSYGENEHVMLEEARKDAVAMLEAAGCTNINSNPVNLTVPGNRIHEMGSARMGNDPSDSVLNKWCQTHDVPNLFVTDGAFMTSAACQNPSISYMAFTARACDHAVKLMQDKVI